MKAQTTAINSTSNSTFPSTGIITGVNHVQSKDELQDLKGGFDEEFPGVVHHLKYWTTCGDLTGVQVDMYGDAESQKNSSGVHNHDERHCP